MTSSAGGQSETKSFQIGLVMAGAVSAGAYTAGVMDFLIEALDRWYEEKEREAAARGSDWSQWTVPPHNAVIAVMSGASAGAMTAAISAVALCENMEPVHSDRLDHGEEVRNRLYSSWVLDADIKHMLGDSDLANPNAPLTSLLNSRILDDIAAKAIEYTWRGKSRPYLADVLPLVLCLTNLRGVPYSIQLTGASGAEHEMSAHADHVSFALVKPEARDHVVVPPTATPIYPDAPVDEGWKALMAAALASGAFPIALTPRVLVRNPADYEERLWTLPREAAKLVDDQYVCQDIRTIVPDWEGRRPDRYQFLNVDAGVMNNEPLELARRTLAGTSLRNVRSGDRANRAIIMIDPFPNRVKFESAYAPNGGLASVAQGIFSSLTAQANFKMDELKLAQDRNVFSRFVIAPTRYKAAGDGEISETHALAGGALAHFSGFLAETFRRHDFLLGRRNCQQFLRRHFALPIENPLFDNWPGQMKNDDRYVIDRDGKRLLPIIPLVGDMMEEEQQPTWPNLPEAQIESLRKQLELRTGQVGARLIDDLLGKRWRPFVTLSWPLIWLLCLPLVPALWLFRRRIIGWLSAGFLTSRIRSALLERGLARNP